MGAALFCRCVQAKLLFPPARSAQTSTWQMSDLVPELTTRDRPELEHEIAYRLAAIVESSDDAIVSKDLNGIVVTWNKGAERIFGYAAEEIIGKPILILIPADRQNEEPLILDRIRRGERIDHYDTVRVRKDGSHIDISLTVSPIKDDQGRVIGASKIARDVTDRKRQERFITLLSREVDHRAKNLLAVVQATVALSAGDTAEDVKAAISGRIQALANAHNLLALSHWEGASLNSIIQQELAAYCGEEDSRAVITGPSQILGPQAAQSIAVVLHELATNAVKYGALSVPAGRVRVEWSLKPNQDLSICWTESEGPKVTPPSREGFGTRVIRMMIKNQLYGDVHFNWHPTGLDCTIDIPFDQLENKK
jgi:PAS domain S-box-containing protein